MADLITLTEYEQAGGDPDSIVAEFAISAASEMVRGYLNQHVSLVEDDVVTLAGTGTRALILPELPVVAINSVTVNGELLVAGDYRESRGVLWRLTSNELGDDGVHIVSTWTTGYEVVVDYDHGFAVVPADIQMVTARLAVAIGADAASTPGMRQETIQDYSYVRGDSSSSSAAELAVIARRVVRQVPVA